MSIGYVLFLRDKPNLAEYTGQGRLARDGDDWTLGPMRVWVAPAKATTNGVLDGIPWRKEIRWVVRASGDPDDAHDFEALATELCVRYRGALWDDATDELRWLWWDRAALEAAARTWKPRALVRWLTNARGVVEDRALLGTGTDGPRQQVAAIALELLAADTKLSRRQRHDLVRELWAGRHGYDDVLSKRVAEVVSSIDAANDDDLLDAQLELAITRGARTTRDALVALYDRAVIDEAAERILLRGLDEQTPLVSELGELLLERARIGAATPGWISDVDPWPWPQLDAAPERATRATRDAFAARGSLAAAIVEHWEEAEAYVETVNDMLERRRRAGEMFAGIPDDVRSIAVGGDVARAVAEYARRYELPLAKAKQVIDANL